MSDLVSGVLTRISELEQLAQSSEPGSALWRRFASEAWDEHIVQWQPDSVLRLCRAHRQIVADYEEAKAASDADTEDISARVGSFALGLAVRAVAVGLGVVEEDRNGE